MLGPALPLYLGHLYKQKDPINCSEGPVISLRRLQRTKEVKRVEEEGQPPFYLVGWHQVLHKMEKWL